MREILAIDYPSCPSSPAFCGLEVLGLRFARLLELAGELLFA